MSPRELLLIRLARLGSPISITPIIDKHVCIYEYTYAGPPSQIANRCQIRKASGRARAPRDLRGAHRGPRSSIPAEDGSPLPDAPRNSRRFIGKIARFIGPLSRGNYANSMVRFNSRRGRESLFPSEAAAADSPRTRVAYLSRESVACNEWITLCSFGATSSI